MQVYSEAARTRLVMKAFTSWRCVMLESASGESGKKIGSVPHHASDAQKHEESSHEAYGEQTHAKEKQDGTSQKGYKNDGAFTTVTSNEEHGSDEPRNKEVPGGNTRLGLGEDAQPAFHRISSLVEAGVDPSEVRLFTTASL